MTRGIMVDANAGDGPARGSIEVDQETCGNCGACASVCPQLAMILTESWLIIDHLRCCGCLACRDVCPVGAIKKRGEA
ncbi:MAG: 4Fe-4S binding protein [Thermodesulfobacteriota bacterium]